MEQLTWTAEKRLVRDLHLWKDNPRKITHEKFAKLKERIVARGFHDVVKIDIDGTILSGNQRKRALQDLKIKEVTVLIPSRPLTDEERNKVALESNGNDGDWDFDKLKSFDFGTLTDVGFDADELTHIWSAHLEVPEDDCDPEEILESISDPITKPGDLIILGQHRLICGDCTDPATLQKLFGDERASMIYSDPPYNINLDYNKGVGGKQQYGGAVYDNRSDDEYRQFIQKSLEAALTVTQSNAHVFYWSDQTYIGLMQEVYRSLSIVNKRVCLWIKNGQNPTPGVAFNKCYEPCTYGVLGKPYIAQDLSNLNEVLNKEIGTGNQAFDDIGDIWTAKRLSGKDYEHATSKPPKLHEKAIKRCTRPGDIILDSFSGSASTLIAAEHLGRRVYGVELEPQFCDLAIKRYEQLTGTKAIIKYV